MFMLTVVVMMIMMMVMIVVMMMMMMVVIVVMMIKVAMKATTHSDLFVFVGTNFFRLKDHFGTCPLTQR